MLSRSSMENSSLCARLLPASASSPDRIPSPGQVTVVALGPLTNLALAVELDPSFPNKIGQIVILGGAYSVNGNAYPAEGNIFGDANAADIVFTCDADILAVGISITHQVVLSGVYLHGPTAFLAAVNPALMTYTEGVARVQTDGIKKGLPVFDNGKERCREMTAWSGKPTVKVGGAVDAASVVELIVQTLTMDDTN